MEPGDGNHPKADASSADWLEHYKTASRRRRRRRSISSAGERPVHAAKSSRWKARRSRKRQLRIAFISIVVLLTMSISLYVMLSRREATPQGEASSSRDATGGGHFFSVRRPLLPPLPVLPAPLSA
jgi:hypothetical protein